MLLSATKDKFSQYGKKNNNRNLSAVSVTIDVLDECHIRMLSSTFTTIRCKFDMALSMTIYKEMNLLWLT